MSHIQPIEITHLCNFAISRVRTNTGLVQVPGRYPMGNCKDVKIDIYINNNNNLTNTSSHIPDASSHTSRMEAVISKLVSTESKEHRAAKNRLARWLNAHAEQGGATPAFAAAVEYPFAVNGDGIRTWSAMGFNRIPTRQQMRKSSRGIIYRADIAIIEGDLVTSIIEIIHSHPTPHWKLDWFVNRGVAVYEAFASTILEVKGTPASFDDILMECGQCKR